MTKQQIILATLLVSFVTSIATGIVTVALMDQAPPGVTQTINRVVERTIEKVVPSPNQQTAAVVTKETIVVKEDDLVVRAVEQNSKSIVSIVAVWSEGDSNKENFVGNGLLVAKDGLIATDSSIASPTLDDAGTPLPKTFKAILHDGSVLPIAILPADAVSGIVLFRPTLVDKTKLPTFSVAKLAEALSLKLGQTIIGLGGEKVYVATGIVSNLSDTPDTLVDSVTASSTNASAKAAPRVITIDIHGVGKTLGAIIANLSGEVVGIRAISAGVADNLFLPASIIAKAVGKI